ncbi:hypothetical protein [Clostridioides difficile]|uniref:hypothetical protein n=1 Tax=Clostridioides difficile TaxID=1496 RepID=UPI003F8D054F
MLLQDYNSNERTIIIATHLIEEVANVIEEVIILDNGKVLLQESVDTVLDKGYSISGLQKDVDDYCKEKNVIGYDELGGMKVAYILGNKSPLPPNSNLQLSSMNLQKLFVKLTEKGGNCNE